MEKMNNLGFYTIDNIPIYSAKIQYIKNNVANTSQEKINNLVANIANDINLYDSKVEEYLNNTNQNENIHDATTIHRLLYI